jgi:hypothetical protein
MDECRKFVVGACCYQGQRATQMMRWRKLRGIRRVENGREEKISEDRELVGWL